MVAVFVASNLSAMTSRARFSPLQSVSAAIAIATLALAGAFALAGAPAQVSPAPQQAASGPLRSGELVEFKTNECGDLDAVRGPHSILNEISLIGDADDEADPMSAWGMPDEDWAVAMQWMLRHPDVAVGTQAVERSCGSDPLNDDEPGTSGVA